MGMFKDKQYEEIAAMMAPIANQIVAMETPDNPRALAAQELAQVLRKHNPNVTVASSLQDAVDKGFALANKEDVIVAFGSLSFTGELTEIVNNITIK